MRRSGDLTAKEIEAGKRIAFFLKNVVRLRKLREACFAAGGITDKRRQEIAALGLPESEFLSKAYGIKMAARGKGSAKLDPRLWRRSAPLVLSHQDDPEYMRDSHMTLQALMARVRAKVTQSLFLSGRDSSGSAASARAGSEDVHKMMLATNQIYDLLDFKVRQFEQKKSSQAEALKAQTSDFIDNIEDKLNELQLEPEDTGRAMFAACIQTWKGIDDSPFPVNTLQLRQIITKMNAEYDKIHDFHKFKKLFITALLKYVEDHISSIEKQIQQNLFKEIMTLKALCPSVDELSMTPVHMPSKLDSFEHFLKTTGAIPSFYTLLNTDLMLQRSEHAGQKASFSDEVEAEYRAPPTPPGPALAASSAELVPYDLATGCNFEELLPALEGLHVDYNWQTQPQQLIIDCARHLVEGLPDSIPIERLNGDPSGLSQQCMFMLKNCLMLIHTFKENFEALNQLYDILVEELSTLLLYHGDLKKYDYNALLCRIYESRCTLLEESKTIAQRHYSTTSGMGSIASAITAIGSQNIGPLAVFTTPGVYFESSTLSSKLELIEAPGPTNTLLSILNSSSPPSGPTVEEIAAMVEAQVKTLQHESEFVNLVLDTTIELDEYPENKLNKLLTLLQPSLESGHLNLILCKSLQKYSLLGTSKVMAGDIAVINNQDHKFDDVCTAIAIQSQRLKQHESPEYPVLLHLLAQGHTFEKKFAFHAKQNAEKIHSLIGHLFRDTEQVQDSPFVILHKSTLRSDRRICTLKEVFDKILKIDFRDSFAFLRPSYLDVDVTGTHRLNPGMSSEQQVIEDFYWLSIFRATDGDILEINSQEIFTAFCKLLDIEDADESPEDLIKSKLAACLNQAPGLEKPFLNNEICSLIHYFSKLNALHNDELFPDLSPSLTELLTIAANSNLDGVSQNMNADLTHQYLERGMAERSHLSGLEEDGDITFFRKMMYWYSPEDMVSLMKTHLNGKPIVCDILSLMQDKNKFASPHILLSEALRYERFAPKLATAFYQSALSNWKATAPALQEASRARMLELLGAVRGDGIPDDLLIEVMKLKTNLQLTPSSRSLRRL